jgi:hypothetical protein
MSQKIHFIFAALLMVSPLCAFAEGSSARGGGNTGSSRIREISEWIDGTSSKGDIKSTLIQIAQNAVKAGSLGTDHWSQLTQLQTLVSKGLIEDIQKAEYQKSKKCVDESGVEKSASTLKVNLIANPDQPHPAVCINMPKLAADNTSYEELVGLLFHEHARHFGIEDTDDDGYQPFSDFITTRYGDLNKRFLDSAKAISPGVAATDRTKEGVIEVFLFKAEDAFKKAAVIFNPKSGSCDRASMMNKAQGGQFIGDSFLGKAMALDDRVFNQMTGGSNWCFGYGFEGTLELGLESKMYDFLKSPNSCTLKATLSLNGPLNGQTGPLAGDLVLSKDHPVKIHFQVLSLSDPNHPEMSLKDLGLPSPCYH